MENKNNMVLFSIVFLIIGIIVGWLMCENKKGDSHMMGSCHAMQGKMMGMDHAMDNMMMGLEGKTGDAFDQAFLSEMIMHHQGAVVMAEAVLENSKRPELVKLAQDIITAQTKEIEMMKGWQVEWAR